MAGKIRLDAFLSEKGHSRSREQAKREILAGWVKVNDETVREPAKKISGDENITVERPGGLFVSRGGEKLRKAIEYFGIHVEGMTAVDLGASTGGFTDCLLKKGAAHVYAVDVGYGQLDYSLRKNPAVTVMERTHVNSLTEEMFSQRVGFVTADLSFISIMSVYPKIHQLFHPVTGIILIKPQFEARSGEQKKGIVRRESCHVEILERTINGLSMEGMAVKGLTFSPIKGPKGNIEFLLYFESVASSIQGMDKEEIAEIVMMAHTELH